VGPPQHVKSNGGIEAWQYCNDFFGWAPADRYVVVWVGAGEVKAVEHFPNFAGGGCDDFFVTIR
jgi:hypothetical protein